MCIRDRASGAQKRYEDKIKKRKKAEIEAKKAAIRAEDIAKGVFVPVSSLPQREPMKGVQTAWISLIHLSLIHIWFLAMMKEVEAGNVEYLCIKDMSRMGRDYLKVGQIMEILRQRRCV